MKNPYILKGSKPIPIISDLTVTLKKAIGSFPGYTVINDQVCSGKRKIAEFYRKEKLYDTLLRRNDVSYSRNIFNKLFAKDVVILLKNKTLYVIEKKFQKTARYVYEKLQTCNFKNKQYNKLLAPLGISVKYAYILNDRFKKDEYRDILKYVESVGCYYFFYELPLNFLGLPKPTK